jgi:hypothetical protein
MRPEGKRRSGKEVSKKVQSRVAPAERTAISARIEGGLNGAEDSLETQLPGLQEPLDVRPTASAVGAHGKRQPISNDRDARAGWRDRDESDLARKALARLSLSRADDRDDWLKVGMACHSINDGLLPDWIAWSSQSDKFKEGECQKQWDAFKDDKTNRIGFGTLIKMAREDSGDSNFGKRPSNQSVQSVFPTLDSAIRAAERMIGGVHDKTSVYEDEEGKAAFAIIRITLPGTDNNGKRKKTFRPVRRVVGGFEFGSPKGKLPIYRKPKLMGSKRIFVTEGEKAADAGAKIGLATTTTAHGAQSAAKSDLSPLAGRDVVILPDNDPPGQHYATTIIGSLLALTPPATVCSVCLPDLPIAGDIYDYIETERAAGKTDDQIRASIEALADRAVAEHPRVGSPNPKKSATRRRRIPRYMPFPIEFLPEPFRSIVDRASRSIGCDPVLVALPGLATLASAIGNALKIRLKRGWSEPAILWALIIAPSGMQKTPAFDLFLRVVDELQQKSLQRHADEMARCEVEMQRYEVHQREWMKSGAAGDPPLKPKEPVAERFYAADSTMEALAMLLMRRWRGMLLLRDELSGWALAFDQYRGGKGGDVAHWLEMHGGAPSLIDRKSGTPPVISIQHASVNLAGCIQPYVFVRVFGNDHMQNGLAARFLLAYPPRRKRVWTEADLPPECEQTLRKLFERILSLKEGVTPDGNPVPREIDLTPGAKKLFIEFFNEHGEQLEAMTGNLSAAWSKLEGYAARLALVIHCMRWAADDSDIDEIDEVSMRAGIALSRWFGNETKRAYTILEESQEDHELRTLAEVIERRDGRISARDWHNLRGHDSADAAEQELQRLVDEQYGEWNHSTPGPAGGRPSKFFVLYEDRPQTETHEGDAPAGVLSEDDSVGSPPATDLREDERRSRRQTATHDPQVDGVDRAVHHDSAGTDKTPSRDSRRGVSVLKPAAPSPGRSLPALAMEAKLPDHARGQQLRPEVTSVQLPTSPCRACDGGEFWRLKSGTSWFCLRCQAPTVPNSEITVCALNGSDGEVSRDE